MQPKTIIAAVIVIVFIIFGATSFLESNLEYTDVTGAMKTHKKVQLKGLWNRDKEAKFDPQTSQFTFYLLDHNGKEYPNEDQDTADLYASFQPVRLHSNWPASFQYTTLFNSCTLWIASWHPLVIQESSFISTLCQGDSSNDLAPSWQWRHSRLL